MIKRLAAAAVTVMAAAGMASTAHAQTYFDVAKLPAPETSGKQLVDEIDAFSNAFAGRVQATPIEANAAKAIEASVQGLGYQTAITELSPGLRMVSATRKGTTKPDESLLFIGHYDTRLESNTAHYDNGSGTLMLTALARAFSKLPTNRTISIIWYSGEENGALASDAHAKQVAEAGGKVRAVLGFDMVGLSWPVAEPTAGKTCLCMWWGDEDEAFEGVLRHVNYKVLGFPEGEGLVEVVGANDRNSDEASWDVAGYPTLRWAGMRKAASYPEYHKPGDNLETMVATAGGRDFLEKGMRNTLESSYRTALALDNEMPVAVAKASGERTVTFDGTGSSDPDGAPSSYFWEFGDGTTAVGPVVQHTYVKAGTYTARLTVTDNLHPSVTSTATAPPVTVAGSPAAAAPGPMAPTAGTKPSCTSKAKTIKNAKKRKAALKKCAKAACTAKAKRIKNPAKRKAALRRCARRK
jgi:hypothetical protein